MAEALEDAAIVAELEEIKGKLDNTNSRIDSTNSKLDIVNSRLNTSNSTLDNIDDNVFTIGESFDSYARFSGESTATIITYLHIFLITGFVILAIVMMCKLGKWIENIICDR